MDPVRILRRQNFLPPDFERFRRCAAIFGGDLERPAEMLARVLEPDAQTVMAADFIIERANVAELFGERRCGLGLSGFEPASELTRQPGLTLRAAADHHAIGT